MPSTQHVHSGSVSVRVFVNRTGPYVRHEIRWTDHHGRRRRAKLSNRRAALKEAKRIADDLAAGHHRSELTLSDLASFRAAIINLYGCGKTLELVTAEYAQARRELAQAGVKPAPSMPELARHWLATRQETKPALPALAAVVATVLQAREQAGASARWRATLRGQLHRFRDDHPGDIGCLTPVVVRQWFTQLRKRPDVGTKAKPALMGARSRNNHLAAAQLLFASPELRHHPERAGILALAPMTVPGADNALWTPKEFRTLLARAAKPAGRDEWNGAHLLPVLVLGGFCKLRSSEILRITWDRIRLADARILLRRTDTKTQRWRIVPIADNARAWLTAVQPAVASAPVWPWAIRKFHQDLRALALACKLRWRPNALRNSAVTYDQMLNPDLGRVAREAGNTPAVLETEYLALQGTTLADAKEWFNILPDRETKVIKLKVTA